MENNKKNEFDDIILDKSNKSEKIKKILLRVIALVILFLVIMIVMKLINGNDSSEKNILPSEPISINTDENMDNQNSFENIPITQEDSAEDQFEILKKQIQGEDAINENNTSDQLISSIPQEPVQSQTIQPQPQEQEKTVVNSQPKDNDIEKNKPSSKNNTANNTVAKAKEESKPKTQDPKELFQKVDPKVESSSDLTPGIYVQIFSVSNVDKKSKELMAVKQKGYNYKLYKTTVNGKEITKVLIGPFSKDTIANELAKIRKDIGKDAFSFTLK
ncbi:SPOR domain-containing protein [Campylobacter novaezeelandiae]|uniref:SPOR domain-containing protein n=1 Tax=Campylobacter novaezeelandiae TaxID=2267891 RepID=UPI0010375B3E|nr:SPOR domain-containing protein [Campylobacter novaezeelandiae]QWU79774.1 SPOR domain-containing protein [Campylobacter novaezeelandiae]TBR78269.1 SPOR domain-containing protein [Campylobacter novaezeelandiae]